MTDMTTSGVVTSGVFLASGDESGRISSVLSTLLFSATSSSVPAEATTLESEDLTSAFRGPFSPVVWRREHECFEVRGDDTLQT